MKLFEKEEFSWYKHNCISVVNSFEEVKYKSGITIVLTTKDNSKKERI